MPPVASERRTSKPPRNLEAKLGGGGGSEGFNMVGEMTLQPRSYRPSAKRVNDGSRSRARVSFGGGNWNQGRQRAPPRPRPAQRGDFRLTAPRSPRTPCERSPRR